MNRRAFLRALLTAAASAAAAPLAQALPARRVYGPGTSRVKVDWAQLEAMEASMIVRRLERTGCRLKHVIEMPPGIYTFTDLNALIRVHQSGYRSE